MIAAVLLLLLADGPDVASELRVVAKTDRGQDR